MAEVEIVRVKSSRVGPTASAETRREELTGLTLLLGRDPDCELVLDDDLVSRQHARLARNARGWTLVDLDSQNGVFVNGVREYQRRLEHGDRVQVGPYLLIYQLSQKEQDAGGLPDIISGTPVAAPPGMQPLPASARRVQRELIEDDLPTIERSMTLELDLDLSSSDGGADSAPGLDPWTGSSFSDEDLPPVADTMSLSARELRDLRADVDQVTRTRLVLLSERRAVPVDQPVFWIGRAASCDLVLPDVSRLVGRSARLERVGPDYVVKRASVLSTVKVNGQAVREVALEDGDILEIGAHRLRFHYGVG